MNDDRDMKFHFGWICSRNCFGDAWSFGFGISHDFGETYFFINAFKHQICIGKLLCLVERGE